MLPACFHLAEAIFPRVRAEAARSLVADGWSQNRAAQALGVSQAMVSKYLGKPADDDPVVRRLAGDLAQQATGAAVDAPACSTIAAVADDVQKEAMDDLLRAEARLFERPPLRVMPQIGLNLARVPRGGSTAKDVFAYPGRIIRAGDRLVVPIAPSAGGSGHLARCLLALRHDQPELTALANVLGTPAVRAAADQLGWDVQTLPAGTDPEARFHEALDGKTKVFHDAGTLGIEPCLYIAGTDARTVAQAITELNEATT